MAELIYIIDDDKNIRDLIVKYIEKEGYSVKAFDNAEDVLKNFNIDKPDMLILDIMMPGMDGYELCKEIRKTSDVPIIIVSARDEDLDKVLGLELGSDDYIAKPFSPRELIARMKSIFRRVKAPQRNNEIRIKDIIIVPDERKALYNGQEIDFTSMEFELVLFLSQNVNKAFTREQLLERVWRYDSFVETRAVDDMVKRIRKKLMGYGCKFNITTIWGYGYKVES
ncbi:response regulator transcription factor [Thermoanaerobacterium sp. RBIITD]|uniref:response regulator transcription factor n=1 Tax=Thermoanaerobacterium sp. RBIITD TaxID=1550240 RepID=UPI000BB910ED|nr:response regulator transcription factor [Thermoanaerobacterium sp. RBIITD]SNX53741.1 DNA-binding response regulator, OmpR family, contains REC and winged-helix (wHTH) domain [Thermoanaerobacterium sp. RBIITD]